MANQLASPSRQVTRIATNGPFTSVMFEYNRLPDPPPPGTRTSLPGTRTSLSAASLAARLAWTTVRHQRLVPLPEPIEADTYQGFLNSFPSLKLLALGPFFLVKTRDPLVALQPERRESDDHSDARCFNLWTLAIHDGTSDRCGGHEVLDALLECIRVRAEAGLRLDEVDVHLYCYGLRILGVHDHPERRVLEAIDRLGAHVGSVAWTQVWVGPDV